MERKLQVCLIRPPSVLPVSTVNAQVGVPPLGMAYLAGTLVHAGFSVSVIDSIGEALDQFVKFEVENLVTQGLSVGEIVGKIPGGTQVVGVSCMFANEWIYARKIVEEIRSKFPEVFIILGGEFPTADYKYLLSNYPEIDCCALGEGEETILEICLKGEEGSLAELSGVKGIAYRKDGNVTMNPRRERIRDLESIPAPAWDLIPLQEYLSRGLGYDTRGKRTLPILASRGCPYQCTFCSSPDMWTTRWSARNVETVLSEITTAIDKHKIEHFEFFDLTMIIRRDWIQNFCREILSRQLSFTWSLPSGTRSEVLDRTTLLLMKEAGCKKISLSPESGSPATLARIKKHLDPESFITVARECRSAGIIAKANIIFGFPGQNIRESMENWLFIARLAVTGINDVSCFRFAPYPGSELFYDLIHSGKLRQDENYEKFLAFNTTSDLRNNQSWSQHLRDWQVSLFMFGGMAIFYTLSFMMRPWRFFQLTYRILRQRPVTMLERALNSIVHGRKSRNLTEVR